MPNVFIASSTEGLPLAKALEIELADVCVPQGWWSRFGNESGITNIRQLLDLLDFDFAVLLLTPDDRLLIRGSQMEAPRDNLIFELGFFIGAMGGLDRALFITPKHEAGSYRLPSDLLGISSFEYYAHKPIGAAELHELRSMISPVGTLISDTIRRLGPRIRETPPSKVGVLANIRFHPVIQFRADQLRFKIGYSGEGLLLDTTFRLFYVAAGKYDDGGPNRQWIQLDLTRSFAPEIRFSFHITHELTHSKLPSSERSLQELRSLNGVFYLTVAGVNSAGIPFRTRKIYQPPDIKLGSFVSVNVDDLPVDLWSTSWDTKPVVDWSKFDEFLVHDEVVDALSPLKMGSSLPERET